MGEVAGQGRTVLFVSHNMTAMSALCQTGIYLEHGRLKAVGTIEETINQYVAETTRPESAGFSPQNRTGNGLVRITDLVVGSGEHQHTVLCGKGMAVELSYEAQREGLPIQFQIGIFDSLNSRILALDSLVAPGLPQTYPRSGKVRLDFGPEFSLHPGCYAVNVAACVHRESVVYVQNALTLVVEEGDLFGSGRMPYGKSQVLYKNQWTFLPS
jgi:lipopolysaccharide transport system ATP-binding protein